MKFEIGLSTLLTIIFIILKLCGVIPWAWVWVFCPIWGAGALALAIAIIVFVCGCIVEAVETKKQENKEKNNE